MNKKKKVCVKRIFTIFVFVLLLVVGCGKEIEQKQEKKEEWEDCVTAKEKVDYQMNHLTLEEKIGQMMIVSYRSPQMDATLKESLTKNQPGGFILFKENFGTYEETITFIDEIKATSRIPMIISIDQEGGIVQRLLALKGQKITNIPAMFYLGKTEDENLAYQVGKLMAEELRAFGINLNFSPSLDIFSNPQNTVIGKRSFGTTPEIVSKMALAVARGLDDNQVTSVFKHFPGHGDTSADSHYSLPVVKKTKEELRLFELRPFQKAIDNNAKVMMIGHLAVPEITEDNTPASLSKQIITGLLKEEMNYKGLVITDALDMGAITNRYQEKEVYEMAINAGVDLLLMPKSSTRAIQYIKESVEENKITKDKIDESVRKILMLKYSDLEKDARLGKEMLGTKEHQDIIDRIKID